MNKTFDEYQAYVASRGFVSRWSEREILAYAALGLGGEAGEVIEPVKKYLFGNRHGEYVIDRENLIEEVGDVLFSLGLIGTVLGFSLEDAARANEEKLRARYPKDHENQEGS